MTKLTALAEAVEKIPDGATLMTGSFLAVGARLRLIGEVEWRKNRDLTIVVNGARRPGQGVGRLLTVKAAPKAIASSIGANPDMQRQKLDGEIEVELAPQGMLAERIRAGGAGG